MFKTKKIFVLFFFASGAVLMLYNCHYIKQSNPGHHLFLETDSFAKMSRHEQSVKCGLCHVKEFENEANGPHSYAYKSLTEHIDFINSDKYNCDFYTKHVNESYNQCAGCHAPANLYETMLVYEETNKDSLVNTLLKTRSPRPLTRTDVSSRKTGIDCMSCHFNGKTIVSLKHIPSPDDSVSEKQSKEVIAANNLVCMACHAEVIHSINPQIAIRKTGSVRCLNCHQEYDSKGNGTHYYFWQHDKNTKVNSKISQVMDDFTFTLSNDKKEGFITWLNKTIPHRISSGPEMALYCEVLSKDSIVLGTKTIRVNNKKIFDKVMYQSMGNNYHFGIEGNDIPLDGKPLTYKFPLKNGSKAHLFKISFLHKSQYWFPDSLGKITSVKYYTVEQ